MKEALRLVTIIDSYLEDGYHLRDINGDLIDNLESAVRAILEGRLMELPAQCLNQKCLAEGGFYVEQTTRAPAALLAEAPV